MPSARQESARFLIPLAVTTALLAGATVMLPAQRWWLALILFVFALLTLFVAFFFRDPERALPADPNLLVSAADGLVVSIEEMEEPDFGLGRMQRIAVFLSVFDVHVNRSPSPGLVRQSVPRAGKFLDARHLDAATENESRAWLLETPHGSIALRQVAGLIARRILAWTPEGGTLVRGERIGMIRFGSRTEVFVPLTCTVLVKPGDRVLGAATPIARWPAP